MQAAVPEVCVVQMAEEQTGCGERQGEGEGSLHTARSLGGSNYNF